MTMMEGKLIGYPLAAALADELVLASQILGELGYELGSDSATLRKHMTSLQKIDLVTQMQLAIVEMLRASAGGDKAIDIVPLEEMASRLRGAVGASG